MLLAVTGCIENRLSVDVLTQFHADGTCTRRVEYRLERVDTEKEEEDLFGRGYEMRALASGS
jgi:hypothetical protein